MTRVLVVDASVIVDFLGRFRAAPIEAVLFSHDVRLVAPELLDIEVLQALRRLELRRAIPADRGRSVLRDFRDLRIRRYGHAALWIDVWRLRANLTAYDAAYVALARLSGGTLVTRDERLANAPRIGVDILIP